MSGQSEILSFHGKDPSLKPYLSMIFSSFLKTLRFGNDWFSEIDQETYYFINKQILERLLTRPESCVRLMVLLIDLDVCLGWSLSEGSTLHYVYVKKDLRRNKIGTDLLPKKIERITHLTRSGKSFRRSCFKNALFNPYLT